MPMTARREKPGKAGVLAAAVALVAVAALGFSQGDADFATQLREIRTLIRAQSAGIPAGTIVLSLDAACPAGFSEVQDLAGVFPVGASKAAPVGTDGGSASHEHRVTVDIAHQHDFSGTTENPTWHSFRKEGKEISNVAEARHEHRFRGRTDQMFNARKTATTEASSTLPPFKAVLFCRKD